MRRTPKRTREELLEYLYRAHIKPEGSMADFEASLKRERPSVHMEILHRAKGYRPPRLQTR